MSRSRPFLRRLALLLASAQLVAYAAAPVVEAITERSPGPAAIERAHTSACVILHAPAACLACQLLTTHGQRAAGAVVPAATREIPAAPACGRVLAPVRPRPATLRSRAPPTDLA